MERCSKERECSRQDFATANTDAAETQHEKVNDAAFDLESNPRATYITAGTAAGISQQHHDFLLQRHGTLDLDPVPTADLADSYNWPQWKKVANLVCVAFHACIAIFTSSCVIPAFESIAMDFNCTLQQASYFASMQIVVLGFAPLFWKPISNRYGRRPVWLISTLGALLFNVGCALSHSYAAMAVCRCFTSFFISPASAIGSGVVTETFFRKERGKYMGIWTLLVTLGPPMGPFFMGFVTYQTGQYRWIFSILAIVNGVQFITYLFLGPETRYVRQGVQHSGSALKQEYLTFRRLDPTPFNPKEFIQPLSLFKYISICIPTISYTVVFGFASVLLTIEIPQLMLPKFGLTPQGIGLQFLGLIIGSIIGEQLGGRLSDWWMEARARKLPSGRRPSPEYRLWLSYAGFTLAIVGLLVFGIQIQNARQGHWNVTPIVGAAIAAAGLQIVTTVLVTYAVDCHVEHSASIGVFVNVVRSTWGFVGPFWYPDMLTNVGGAGSGGIMAGLILLVSVLPIGYLHVRGQRMWRRGGRNGGIAEAGEKERAVEGQAVVSPR